MSCSPEDDFRDPAIGTDITDSLLHILMGNLERSVCIGGNPGNAVLLPNDDDLAVLALIADTLIIKILHLLHSPPLLGNYKFHLIQKK